MKNSALFLCPAQKMHAFRECTLTHNNCQLRNLGIVFA
jgi:hypothetical protein